MSVQESTLQLDASEFELKKDGESEPRALQGTPTRAPVTTLLLVGVVLAVMQSFNFGLGIGLVNLSAPVVQVVSIEVD